MVENHHVVYLYNPALMHPEDVNSIFVDREETIVQIVNAIKDKKTWPNYYLLRGDRGVGKTLALRKLKNELLKESSKNKRNILKLCIISYLDAEEIDAVISPGDVLLKIAAEAVSQCSEQVDINPITEEDYLLDEKKKIKLAGDIIKKIGKSGIYVLLLIDNFDKWLDHIENIRKDARLGSKILRRFWSENRTLSIVGTAINVDKFVDYNQPFFGDFEIIEMEPFDPDKNSAIIEKLVENRFEFEGKAHLLESTKAKQRINAIAFLSGGHPRMIHALCDVLLSYPDLEIGTLFGSFIDKFTPFYEEKVNLLTYQQRHIFYEIIKTISKIGGTFTAREITKKSRFQQGIVNSQLSRLEKSGYIRLVGNGAKKAMRYKLSDPLLGLWYMTRGIKSFRENLRSFAEFALIFYTTTELSKFVKTIEPQDGIKSRETTSSTAREISFASYIWSRMTTELQDDLREGRYESCIGKCTALLNQKIDPEVLNTRGISFAQIGKGTKSLSDFKKALKMYKEKGNSEGEANQLGNIGLIYFNKGGLDSALKHLQDALKIHKACGYKQGEAIQLGNIGLIYSDKGELDEALKYHKDALKIDQEIGYKQGEATQLGNIGLIYSDKGELDEALKYLRNTLKFFQKIGYNQGEATALSNIGHIYRAKGDLDNALKYHQDALKIDREIGYKQGEASDLGNIGLILKAKGDLDNALKYLKDALKIDQEIGYKQGEASDLGNIGLIYRAKGDLENALKYHQDALKIDQEIGYKQGEANQLGNIGLIYSDKGDLENALKYHQDALNIHREIGYKQGEASALGNIGLIYRAKGDLENALKYLKDALKIHREITYKHGEVSTEANLGALYIELANRSAMEDNLGNAREYLSEGILHLNRSNIGTEGKTIIIGQMLLNLLANNKLEFVKNAIEIIREIDTSLEDQKKIGAAFKPIEIALGYLTTQDQETLEKLDPLMRSLVNKVLKYKDQDTTQ